LKRKWYFHLREGSLWRGCFWGVCLVRGRKEGKTVESGEKSYLGEKKKKKVPNPRDGPGTRHFSRKIIVSLVGRKGGPQIFQGLRHEKKWSPSTYVNCRLTGDCTKKLNVSLRKEKSVLRVGGWCWAGGGGGACKILETQEVPNTGSNDCIEGESLTEDRL